MKITLVAMWKDRKMPIALMLLTMAAGSILVGLAEAITAPAATAFAYTVYDVAVNNVLKGPIGFVGGVGAIAMGVGNAFQGKIIPMALCLLGGGALIKADSIVTSMGAIF